MKYDDLAALITGLGPGVVMPGEQNVALPVFLIEPRGVNMIDGFEVLHHDCEVSVRVPLGSGDPGQFDAALEYVRILIGALLVTPIMVGEAFPVDVSTESSPPTINVTVPVVFPASDLIRPVPAAPEPEPEPEPEP